MEQWQRDIKNSVTTFEELQKMIPLSLSERKFFEHGDSFCFSLTPQVLKLIDTKDPKCPIRLQFIPRDKELLHLPKESHDPLDDAKWSPVAGIVHRYKNRCLLIPHMCCPAYCRFCFRKNVFDHFCFDESKSFEYIKKHKEIEEVILSGGDPLLMNDVQIESLLKKLDAIKHLDIIRFHTRLPVTLPSRFTRKLQSLLKNVSKQVVVVIHVNHPKEMSSDFRQSVKILADAHVMLLSQSVLLKGVNDNLETLRELFVSLTSHGIKPYYLHQLDRASGTSHFDVNIEKGKRLMKQLQKEIFGISLPQYVVDTGDTRGKLPLL